MATRSKALWTVTALLLVNAVLLVAQPALALPNALGNYFFGPKLVRAEVLLKEGSRFELYRIDRGTVRDVTSTVLVVREQDGALVRIPLSAATQISGVSDAKAQGRGRGAAGGLKRGMRVTAIRKGDGPAVEVRAGS